MPDTPTFTYADITDPCTADGCKNGTAYSPHWKAWWERHDAARAAWQAINPDGDWHASPECEALDAKLPEVDEESDCRACRGTGRVPNTAGHAILQLVAAWRQP